MAKKLFQVYNTFSHQHCDVIEMDDELVAPDKGIMNHTTGMLDQLKNGKQWTLVPMENHDLSRIEALLNYYKAFNEPIALLGAYINRVDGLMNLFRAIFEDTSYTVVESKEDLEAVLAGGQDTKKVTYNTYTRLRELIGADKEEHKCGPGCSH